MATDQSSGHKIISFLIKNHRQIQHNELNNKEEIHLYGIGSCWIALERSAFQLYLLFPEAEVYPISIHDDPFPIVMAAIPDYVLCNYKYSHIIKRDMPDFKAVKADTLNESLYQKWHLETCKSLLSD